METATFAGGCFWCTEAIFQRLKGVKSVLPGYSGGHVENPTYQDVSSGNTGHAEAIQIEFDPKKISYEDLLHVFFKTHDPTTKNRQGADVGPQYRSIVFYHNDSQKRSAEEYIKSIPDVVTALEPFKAFYVAEDYHKNYYNNNKNAGYCMLVIDPKIKKLQENFSSMLK